MTNWYDEPIPRTRSERVHFEVRTALEYPELRDGEYLRAFQLWMAQPVSLEAAVEVALRGDEGLSADQTGIEHQ